MQVASSDFAVSQDGSLVSRTGGNVTMLDVLLALEQPAGSPGRRHLSGICAGGALTNNACQDNTDVIAWQTTLGSAFIQWPGRPGILTAPD